MPQITILSVGNVSPFLREGIAEYEKRLSAFATLRTVAIKETKIHREEDAEEVRRALEEEGERLLDAVPKGAKTIALCVEGKTVDSVSLAKLLQSYADEVGKLCFLIGSSHGLSPKVKAACDYRLSVSALTFPHQLMRLLLAEILYRSFCISLGKPYHK